MHGSCGNHLNRLQEPVPARASLEIAVVRSLPLRTTKMWEVPALSPSLYAIWNTCAPNGSSARLAAVVRGEARARGVALEPERDELRQQLGIA